MGCDGYLYYLKEPKNMYITCYDCGKKVDLENPIKGHENCVDGFNREFLRVDYYIDDYE